MLAGLHRKDMVLSFRDYSRSKGWSLQAPLPTVPVEREKRTWETYHVASHLSICCRMERLLRFASPSHRSDCLSLLSKGRRQEDRAHPGMRPHLVFFSGPGSLNGAETNPTTYK